jgi:hypothetical protein
MIGDDISKASSQPTKDSGRSDTPKPPRSSGGQRELQLALVLTVEPPRGRPGGMTWAVSLLKWLVHAHRPMHYRNKLAQG